MPNQTDPNSNQPTNQPVVPPVTPVQSDLPPLPPAFQSATASDPVVPPINQSSNQPITTAPGSATPPDLSSVISSKPKKKFGGGRVIATILGILLLIGGIGTGVFLVQQKQLFQQKAGGVWYWYEGCISSGNTPSECSRVPHYCSDPANNCTTDPNNCGSFGHACGNGDNCGGGVCVPNPDTGCKHGDNGAPVCCTGGCGGSTVCEGHRKECHSGGTWCTIDGDSPDCTPNNTPEPPGPSTPPSAPPTARPTPGPTAQCLSVKAYGTSGNNEVPLTGTQLSALHTGDTVNFCVKGSETASGGGVGPAFPGSFDSAQFSINGVTKPVVNLDKTAAANGICQPYTILTTDTTVNVKAKIHHTIAGWVGENF